MIKITVPATTANLGPGFDSLGLALNIYNVFYMKEGNSFSFINIKKKYANINNLVVQSSIKTYEYLKEPIKYYSLSIDENVPIARGLGSSATCIIAGILGALYFCKKELSKEKIIEIATSIEGHPDNISPALLGNLIASVIIDNNKILYCDYKINNDLLFTAVIPNIKLETKIAREVLPNSLTYKDIIYSLSRAINIPKVLQDGNIEYLYYFLKDKIHEPYRFPLINGYLAYYQYSELNKIPFCLSGSGSTLLFITNKSIKEDLSNLGLRNEWLIKELRVDEIGAQVVEIDEK